MKILMITYSDKLSAHIAQCFETCGQEVILYEFPHDIDTHQFVVLDETNRADFSNALKNEVYDVIFSIEYIHEISMYANALGVIYLSWILYLPNPDIYRSSVGNLCNAIFACDSTVVELLKSYGAENAYYLANAAISLGNNDYKSKYGASFIEKITILSEEGPFGIESKLSAASRGYIDGMAHCQRLLHDRDVISGNIPQNVRDELLDKYRILTPTDVSVNIDELINYNYFRPYITMQERRIALASMKHVAAVFSDIPVDILDTEEKKIESEETMKSEEKIKSKEKVESEETLETEEMTGLEENEQLQKIQEKSDKWKENFHDYITDISKRKEIYAQSDINVYITDRAMPSGIAHQVFDIMSSKGFLLMSHQNDMAKHFVCGKDYIEFSNVTDMTQAFIEYGPKSDLRREIAENGFNKIKKEHLMIHRIQELLSVF